MRSCGVLLPVSSLPSRYGIGTLGREAYHFIDFLKAGGCTYWQLLPLAPTGYGDSPYQPFSDFAGNPYFIDLETLVGAGLLARDECDDTAWGDAADDVDYGALYGNRLRVLRLAFGRTGSDNNADFAVFKADNSSWLDDYALFMALKAHFGDKPWASWDEPVKFKTPAALDAYRTELRLQIEFWKYTQYLFYTQYAALKAYAEANGVKIIGDMPIYPAWDSADVWADTPLFSFDDVLDPVLVAGVPPDYFSRTGQLWGNPVYRWDTREAQLFEWWEKRLAAAFKLYDMVRIDHFRGFDQYYAVPYGEETAENGVWKNGPGRAFFDHMNRKFGKLPFIAENLGIITDSVSKLLDDTGYPGMRVLQFGLRAGEDSTHLTHNYDRNSVVYTGTHDNDTLTGWYDAASERDRDFAAQYVRAHDAGDFADGAIAALYASVSDLVVVPMQDWLALGSQARMNTPSTVGINWKWRLAPDLLTPELSGRMRGLAVTYRRAAE